MNAKETVEAMVDAYLLPTIGLNPLVKSLLACVRYFLEVMESLSRSGKIVWWNFDGRSLNSATKSSSSSWSSQLCCFLVWGVFFGLVCFWFLFCFWDSVSPTFLSTRLCVCFVEAGLVVLLVDGPSFRRSDVFLVGAELAAAFDVELSFLSCEVEFSFLSWEVELEGVGVALVEFVDFVILVWFLVDRLPVLMSLVWFFVDRLGLASLVWFLLDILVLFFLGTWSSFVSTSNILLLTRNCLASSCVWSLSEEAQGRRKVNRNKTRKSRSTCLRLKQIKYLSGAILWNLGLCWSWD